MKKIIYILIILCLSHCSVNTGTEIELHGKKYILDWVEAMVKAYNYNLKTKGKFASKKISLYKVKMKKDS